MMLVVLFSMVFVDGILSTSVNSNFPENFNKILFFLFKQLQGFELIFLIFIEGLFFSKNEIH
jgi:hypothetical protein